MTTNETPTPRTTSARRINHFDKSLPKYIVPVEVAEELERELAEARKLVADWQVLQATTEQELAREKLRAEENGKLAHNLGIELVAERALADRLASAAEYAVGWDYTKKALAAWRKSRNE